ncbi:MAG TPA: DUF6458 family protein [Jiangellaceae bacterium]|nr:DUF6458 family protein [Jiangellaceae bacterium]
MGIGVGVFLLAIGAILAFAIEWDPAGVSIDVMGWILMVAGALAVLMELLVFAPRRRAGRTVSERRTYEDEPPAY